MNGAGGGDDAGDAGVAQGALDRRRGEGCAVERLAVMPVAVAIPVDDDRHVGPVAVLRRVALVVEEEPEDVDEGVAAAAGGVALLAVGVR